jgi:hypothetical protein
VSVGVLSNAGQLNFTIAGGPVAVPDLAVFACGTLDALRQPGALAGPGPGRNEPSTASAPPDPGERRRLPGD